MAEETPAPWPKWQVGAAVGAGVAVAAAAGYIYYKSRSGDSDATPTKGPSTASPTNTSSSSTASGSRDATKTADERGASSASGDASKDASAPKAAAEGPMDLVQKYKSLGNTLYRSGKFEEAIVQYKEGLDSCPANEGMQLSIFYQNIAATYERMAELATDDAVRDSHWTNVRDSCTNALKHNEKYLKAYTRRARSNYVLKDFSAALEDVTAANLLETAGSGQKDATPSEQVMSLATRILKDLGEEKATVLYDSRPPIVVSKTFIRTYLESFYFELARFYDVSDDVLAECVAAAEQELEAYGLTADGEKFTGAESERLPISRDSVGYSTPARKVAAAAAEVAPAASEDGAAAAVENGASDTTDGDDTAAAPSMEETTAAESEGTASTTEETPAAESEGTAGTTEETPAAEEATAGETNTAEDAGAEGAVAAPKEPEDGEVLEEGNSDEAAVTPAENGETSEITEEATPTEPEQSDEATRAKALREEGERLYLRAVLQYKNEQFPLANQAARRALLFAGDDEERFTKHQIAHLHLIEATTDHLYSRFDSAGKALDRVVEMDTSIPAELLSHALIKRGSQHLVHAQPDQALLDFQRASTLTPTSADVFHHRGQMHGLMNHMTEAMADYNQAVNLAPDWPAAAVQRAYSTYKMASLMQDTGLLAQTTEQFEEIKRKFPNFAEGLYMYGQVTADTGDLDATEELYAAARKADPTNVSVRVHEALLVLQREHDVEKTLELLNDAVNIDPCSEFVYETMAQLEVQRHNIDKAIACWDKALLLVRTRLEVVHLVSLREATVAQAKVCKKLNIDLSAIASEMF